MKHINSLIFFLCLLTLPVYTGCKDDESELIPNTFEISGSELNKEIDFRSTTMSIPVKTNLRPSQWSVNSDQRWVTAFQQDDKIMLSILDNQGKEKRYAKLSIKSEAGNYTVNLTQYGVNDIDFRDDTKIEIQNVTTNTFQPSWEVTYITDGIKGAETQDYKHWHSNWNKPVTNEDPAILEFDLPGDKQLDYFIYYPRNGNGNFGEFEVYVQTAENPTYVLAGTYNFGQQGGFTGRQGALSLKVNATKVKFVINSGQNRNASCAEMEFYEKSNYRDLNHPLLTVFTDYTCSALKEGVTDEEIDALDSETFKRVAYALKNNTYDEWEKDFRIREYEAYSNINYWSNRLQTKKYSNLDNPTGIYVSKDEEVIVLVGSIPAGQQVSLQCIWEENVYTSGSTTDYYKQTQAIGTTYSLEEGVNLLKMQGPGQLFVMYNVDGEQLLNQPAPIKIHIPLGHGVVNGFFDLKEHKTDEKYAELISKATHKYFCVRGEKMIFYFHRLKMLDAAPTEISSAIHLWDDIVGWEQSLMGISQYREEGKINNHMFSISPEGAYMWASDYRMGFIYTYLKNILLRENVMAAEDNAWGPAHEMGHVHQEAINWPSSTESSNNLFSNYVIRKLGKYKSRGRGLTALANAIYRDKQAWWNMGTSTHQNEDTEIHMRMNWQLWIYYELCKGHENKAEFWPKVFDIMRTTYGNIRITTPATDNPAEKQLAFAKAVCEAAHEDLTEFFETWGLFKTVDKTTIEQYGNWVNYEVTEEMVAETKQWIKNQNYPKAAPIQYIEDRKTSEFTSGDYRYKEVGDVGYYTQFINNEKITKTPTYTMVASVTGSEITVKNGEQAVAFEVRKQTADGAMGEVVYFSNFLKFSVPRNIPLIRTGMYAVQADGERIPIHKE